MDCQTRLTATRTFTHGVASAVNTQIQGAAWDALRAGILLVTSHRRVLGHNRAAARILARDDGLRLHADALIAASADEEASLASAFRDAQLHGTATAAIWSRSSARPYLLTLTRLGDGDSGAPSGHFLVAIADPVDTADPGVLRCARALGLTQGEAALAAALVRGETVSENARRRRVSVHTVRSQLRNIREKLGLSRQSELICWLTRAALCMDPVAPDDPAPATPANRLTLPPPPAAAPSAYPHQAP